MNAGHDLDLKNLTIFKALPHLDEVSIGHALVSRAIFVGLGRVVKEYLAALAAIVLAVLIGAPLVEAAGRPVTLASSDGVIIAGEYFEAAFRPSSAPRAAEDKAPAVLSGSHAVEKAKVNGGIFRIGFAIRASPR